MNSKEIQQIMKIVRPAIIAVYGRQSLRLVKYHDSLAYRGKPMKSLWLQVEGTRYYDLGNIIENYNYKLQIENGRVTSLSIGELEI